MLELDVGSGFELIGGFELGGWDLVEFAVESPPTHPPSTPTPLRHNRRAACERVNAHLPTTTRVWLTAGEDGWGGRRSLCY